MTELNSPAPEIELYESLLDRDQVEIPRDYLPSTQGVLIAGKSILQAAGCGPVSTPPGWSEWHGSFVRKVDFPLYHGFYVRPYGNFWGIERATIEFQKSIQDHDCVLGLLWTP